MLKVVCKTSPNDFGAFLLKIQRHVMENMRQALITLCKECEAKARNNDGGWQNQTGNLRSSIGGAVYENGRILFTTSFEQVLRGSKGRAEGYRMIQELASQYTDAVAMVIVAGMDYAEKVESIDSKDVLESTRIFAESVVRRRLEEAKEKAITEINSWK